MVSKFQYLPNKEILLKSEMENICYGDLKHKYTTCASSPSQSEFFPMSPKGIWEMEISKAREMAENNMYKLRITELHSGSLRDYLWKHLLKWKNGGRSNHES